MVRRMIIVTAVLALGAAAGHASELRSCFRLQDGTSEAITIPLEIRVPQKVHAFYDFVEGPVCAFVVGSDREPPLTLPLVPLDFYDLDPLEQIREIRSHARLAP